MMMIQFILMLLNTMHNK